MGETRMLINYVPGEECRVAIVTDGLLEELQSERANAVTIVGNIYVGKVVNVEPSIQAAFVDFGTGSNGFLHISDVHPQYFPGEDEETTERIGHKTPRRERPPIQSCLKRGQEVLVQVLKEGISTKGPTLTSYLSIPGKYLVMLPQMDRVGVSRKVEDDESRRAMREILDQLELPEGFGFIVRTAGMDRGKMELKRDLAYLQRLWKDIEVRLTAGNQPRLLYAESDLLMRALRDTWTSEINEIVIDNEAALHRAARFMKIVAPRCTTKLLHYDRLTPMFSAYGIEEQIARIHAREVPLPSGGSLIIDEAEAMVAIDVNSGKMRDNRDAETTAYKTNVEAVDEICRQLKLRDVGGLIMCDLIDMVSRKNRKDIENRFKDRLKRDRAATKPLPISEFGIVEMTRQRQRGSFRSLHFTKCPLCIGRGLLRKPESLAGDAIRELGVVLDHENVAKIELVVSPRVAGELLSSRRQALWRVERVFNKHVDVRVSEDIPVDAFRIYAYSPDGADIDVESLPRMKVPKKLTEWKIGGDESEADWTIDSSHEAHDVPPPEVQEALSPMDAALEAAERDLAAAPVENFNNQSEMVGWDGQSQNSDGANGGRRRRRRRGRGGRGGRGNGEGQPVGVPVPQGMAPVVDHHSSSLGAPTVDGAHGDAGEGGAGRKRRRRRRRGRGGRGGEGAPMDGAPQQNQHAPTGDSSWDVDPNEVRPLTPNAPASSEPSSWDVDPSEVPALSPQNDSSDFDTAQGDDESSGEGQGKKKRRRRRRGRGGRGGHAGEGAADAPGASQDHIGAPAHDAADVEPVSDATNEPASSNADEEGAQGGGSRRRGRRGRGGRGGGRSENAERPSENAPQRRATPAVTPQPKPKAPPTPVVLPQPELGVSLIKPVRTLYGFRRRVPPGTASKQSRDE